MTPRAQMLLEAAANLMPSRRATLRREGTPDCRARIHVAEFSEAEIVGGIQEGQRKLIVFAPDVTWVDPLREGDLAILDGRELYINIVDSERRRVDGVLIAYEIRASGL